MTGNSQEGELDLNSECGIESGYFVSQFGTLSQPARLSRTFVGGRANSYPPDKAGLGLLSARRNHTLTMAQTIHFIFRDRE